MAIIECSNIIKDFRIGLFGGKVSALKGVDLEVQAGEIFGILGPNGAGKTTLVKIILDLVKPTMGTVKLFDQDSTDHRSRGRIGYLPENPNLPSYLTGGQILELFGKLSKLSAIEIEEQTIKLLAEVKMSQWRDKKISTYSKGMIQRLGLAQAMIGDPDIIFLDEPTDGVDPIGRMEIRQVLKGLKDRGKTILLNSHLLSETEMLCDHVVIIDKGLKVASGNLEELTSGENRYKVKCGSTTPDLMNSVANFGEVKNQQNGTFEIAVNDLAKLNEMLDLLRQKNLLIEELSPVKQSLESYFIDLITDIRGEIGE